MTMATFTINREQTKITCTTCGLSEEIPHRVMGRPDLLLDYKETYAINHKCGEGWNHGRIRRSYSRH